MASSVLQMTRTRIPNIFCFHDETKITLDNLNRTTCFFYENAWDYDKFKMYNIIFLSTQYQIYRLRQYKILLFCKSLNELVLLESLDVRLNLL